MAWSGNLRCLHCDGKLPLYRKLTSGQFCSKAHSDAYWQEQERLAVERLHQTHDSLRAYRAPADTLEAILGKPAASEPVSSAHYYQSDDVAAAEPIQPELEISDMARSAANTGNVTFAGFVVEEKPGLRAWDAIGAAWNAEFMLWPMSRPAIPQSAGEKQDYTLGAVSAVPMPRFLACGFASMIRTDAEKSGPVEFAGKPVTQIPLGFVPEPSDLSQLLPEVVPEVAENLPPFAESLMALQKFGAQAVLPVSGAHVPEPIETAPRAQNTRLDATFATPAVVAVTRLEPLTLSNAPKALAAPARAASALGALLKVSGSSRVTATTAGVAKVASKRVFCALGAVSIGSGTWAPDTGKTACAPNFCSAIRLSANGGRFSTTSGTTSGSSWLRSLGSGTNPNGICVTGLPANSTGPDFSASVRIMDANQHAKSRGIGTAETAPS